MWQMQELTRNRDLTMRMIGRLSSWIWQTCLSSPGQRHRRTNRIERMQFLYNAHCMRLKYCMRLIYCNTGHGGQKRAVFA